MGIIHLPNINVQDTLKRIRCICRISDIPRSAIVSIESVDSIIESVDSICRDSADRNDKGRHSGAGEKLQPLPLNTEPKGVVSS